MKKIFALATLLFTIMLVGVCAQAADLEFITANNLPEAIVNDAYSVDIEVQGGTAPYSFSLNRTYYLPPGLTFSSDSSKATISGTPTTGGTTYSNIGITVTDNDGNSIQRTFSIAVFARIVTFEIGQNNFTFDGLPHKVADSDIVAKYNGSDVTSLIDYVITYSGANEQTNAGNYPIRITVTTPGFLFGSISDSSKEHLKINRNTDVIISYSNLSLPYTGSSRAPTISVQGRPTTDVAYSDISYSTHYEGLDSHYSSSTAPTNVGIYRVSSTVEDGNYETPSDNYAVFEITPLSVTSLTVQDYTADYTGNPISMPAANISVTPSISYEVEYAASGSSSYSTTAPTASGVYNVRVHTTEPNYETVYAYATLTINAEGVVFTVTGDSTVEYDGNPHYLSVSANPSVAFTYEYKDAVTGATVTDPTNAGTYNLSISLTDTNAYSVSGTVGPTALVITPKQVKFTVPATLSYTGGQQTPTVTTDPVIANTMYDVSYTLAPNAAQTYVEDMGTYDVSFTFKDEYKDNYEVTSDSSTTITVEATQVTFAVSGDTEFTYDDGISHTVTLTPTPSVTGYDVTYTNTVTGDVIKQSENPTGPSDAGTYNVNVVFPANSGYTADLAPTTVKVNQKEIKFELNKTTIPYDNQDHDSELVITTTPNIASSLYTVKYQQNNTDKTVHDVGTYNVVIEFTGDNGKNYVKSSDSVSTLEVTGTTVNFVITDAEFVYGDGVNHVVSVTPSETLALGTDYEITYTKDTTVIKQSETPAGPSDAGTYAVGIDMLNSNYTKGTVSTSSLTVKPVTVFFVVTGATQTDYDGQVHTTTVAVDHTDPTGRDSNVPAFSLTYQKGTDTPSADMTDAGEYTVIVAFDTPTDNYIIDSGFNATYTINTVTSMNYGNSPAAMIYKDAAAEHDDQWKADAIDYLTANRKFGTYLPTGFDSYVGNITYPTFGSVDIDANPYTVLVSGYDLSGFVDPGMVVNGSTITGSAPVLENSTDGLYKVTYTSSENGTELGSRYVVLVNRIGDANGNKMVNAIDANYIEKYVNENKGSDSYVTPGNAIQARTWDVTKDGKLDGDDVLALNLRFRTALIPYYPWI